MGIASLSLGACALVVAWIPCLGMFTWPVSGIGLLLGAVGLIVAFTRQGSGLAFPIAGTATSFVALGIAVYQVMFWHRATSDVRDLANRVQVDIRRQQEQMRQKFGKVGGDVIKPGEVAKAQEGGLLQLNNGVALVSSNLTDADPKDKKLNTSPAKAYTVKMAPGKTYQIDLVSQAFDAFLRLEDPAGKEVAENDDVAPGNLNSQIVYNCPQAGEYRIIATSLPSGIRPGLTGQFTLRVQEK
jgi:hypothetical protein